MNLTIEEFQYFAALAAPTVSALPELTSLAASLTNLEQTMTVNVQALLDETTKIANVFTAFKTQQDAYLTEGRALMDQAKALVESVIAANDAQDQAAIDAGVKALSDVIAAGSATIDEVESKQAELLAAAVANTAADPAVNQAGTAEPVA